MNKILIVGFPHSGTSILKKIIGNHDDVFEYPYETPTIPEILNPNSIRVNNIVIKWTVSYMDELRTAEYHDFKIIMLIKNPYDVFGSFYKRFATYDFPPNHTLKDWVTYAESFLKYNDIKKENVFTIKYENLFKNELPKLFNFLGLSFSDGLVKKKRDSYISDQHIKIPITEPKSRLNGYDHGDYRTWQINQEFTDMTGNSAVYLTAEFKNKIANLPIIKLLGY